MNIQNLLSYNFYNLFFYFIIYSFLGWCVEVLYAYKNQRKFVNRGFLHGPICPIYGLCISSMVIVLANINVTLPFLLIVATIVISIIEYLTGYILEKLFKTKYWDYTDDPFNIHGRICLHFSIMWGITSVGVVKILHPLIQHIVTSFTPLLSTTLLGLLFILFIFDIAYTISKLANSKKFNLNIQLETLSLFNRFKK